MDVTVNNQHDVCFILSQKALLCFREIWSCFIEKQSKEYYLRIVDFITSSFPNHTCEECGLSSGASNASLHSGNEICGRCKDQFIEFIRRYHSSGSPNLRNANWTDHENRSWQHFKCYIDEEGHTETASAKAAGVNALFQICFNHDGLKKLCVEELSLVKEIYDDILRLMPDNFSEELCTRLIRAIQDAFKKFAQGRCELDAKAQSDYVSSLVGHHKILTKKDEILARQQIIKDLERHIAFKDVPDHDRLNVSLGIHQRALDALGEAIKEAIRREESELQERQSVLKTKKDSFMKIMPEKDQLQQQNPVNKSDLHNMSCAYQKHIMTLVTDMHADTKEIINVCDEQRKSMSIVEEGLREIRQLNQSLLNRGTGIVTAVRENTELKLKLFLDGGGNNAEIVCTDLVAVGEQLLKGERPRDDHFDLHNLMQSVLEYFQNGGNQIKNITHGCVAIHIGCPTLSHVIALCETFLSGQLTEVLKPLQDLIKTMPGCKDVCIVPIILEKDFVKCIKQIVTEVKGALNKKHVVSVKADSEKATQFWFQETATVPEIATVTFTKVDNDITGLGDGKKDTQIISDGKRVDIEKDGQNKVTDLYKDTLCFETNEDLQSGTIMNIHQLNDYKETNEKFKPDASGSNDAIVAADDCISIDSEIERSRQNSYELDDFEIINYTPEERESPQMSQSQKQVIDRHSMCADEIIIQIGETNYEHSCNKFEGNIASSIQQVDTCSDIHDEIRESEVKHQAKIKLDFGDDEPVDLGQFPWYWGETHQELVRRELSRAPDGSYLVHHSGDIEFHTLAVKVGDDIVWQPIYCRDGLVGFTEPLGFESFEDALEAYTESQTETHDTLRNPLTKPDFSKLRETHTAMQPVQLLKRLRDTHGLLGQRIDELDNVEGCIERLEQEVEEKGKSMEAYGVLIKVVSKQLEKTNELTSSSDRLEEISNNCTALTKRLEGLRLEQTAIERERTSLEAERNEQSKLSTRCLDGIRVLENELQKIKDDIIEFSLYENCMDTMMLFIDHLLASDVTEYAEKVEEYDLDKSVAKAILKTESDGTFIVRTSNNPQKPYSISVSYSDAETEGLVAHFPVKRDDGCLGFDEQTCIFQDIQDLVTCYSRIPFGSHDSTYGDLTLVRQVERGAIEEGRKRKSSVLGTLFRKMSVK